MSHEVFATRVKHVLCYHFKNTYVRGPRQLIRSWCYQTANFLEVFPCLVLLTGKCYRFECITITHIISWKDLCTLDIIQGNTYALVIHT